jgi:hypothetical protein
MSKATASSLFVNTLTNRLTEPRVLAGQFLLIPSLLAVRQFEVIPPTNPVFTTVVLPACAVGFLFLAVDIIQRVALRLEGQAHENTDLAPCWQGITDRTLVAFNAGIVLPVLLWGQPIVGTIGYTTESLTAVLPVATVSGDHTAVNPLLVGGVLVGSAMAARSLFAWIQVQFGPDLSTDRLETYLALRASVPASGSKSLIERSDGGEEHLSTVDLADACVEYSLTQVVPDGVPSSVDIEQITETLPTVSASTPAKMVFLTTLNARFLVGLFGSLAFIYSGIFGLYLPSIHPYTLWLATVLGVGSQIVYNHPFVSRSRDVLRM